MTMYGSTKEEDEDVCARTPDYVTVVDLSDSARVASSTDLNSHPEQSPSVLEHSSNEQPDSVKQDLETESLVRNGSRKRMRSISREDSVFTSRERRVSGFERSSDGQLEFEKSCVVLMAENPIEAQRINNNYKFGMKKWKSHVTSRPIDVRSEIVQDLYSDISKIKDIKVKTLRPSNVIYTLLFGWWLSLLYAIIGGIMFVSVVGIPYANFCWSFAAYFFWPFGKFVHQVKPYRNSCSMKQLLATPDSPTENHNNNNDNDSSPRSPDQDQETSPLVKKPSIESLDTLQEKKPISRKCMDFWSLPASWVWTIFGLLPLLLVHSLVFAISWFFIVSIPTAKVNGKMLTKILFLPPHEIVIKDTEVNIMTLDGSNSNNSEIVMYTHQSINVYYYKYTVDGVNVILTNSLVFVVLSLIIGYAMDIEPIVKCVLGVLAIIPLTYYIGTAITSISAQSSFAVGALLNATFGSAVEVILFIIMLDKGSSTGKGCYQELVKSSLTGAILCSILFIPGMSMVIGGLKYRTQKFNPKSISVYTNLLFLAIIGAFSPSFISLVYGHVVCSQCSLQNPTIGNHSGWKFTSDITCDQCDRGLLDPDNSSLYKDHIRPLVYCVCVLMPIAYIVGIVFTMKTHSVHVFAEFDRQLKEENENEASHGTAHWSRVKSVVILFLSAVCIALCGDLISDNIQPLLEATGISEYFVGVTMLSLVTELPEVVNGIQFALQNNVNLGIEIGCSTAVQVCLVQIPLLVLADVIHDMEFFLIFNYVHLCVIVFSVLIIRNIFQDGQSDYFQGAIVVIIYILFMCLYLFIPTPDGVQCESEDSHPLTTVRPFTLPFTIPIPP